MENYWEKVYKSYLHQLSVVVDLLILEVLLPELI